MIHFEGGSIGDGSGFTTAVGDEGCDTAVGVKPEFTFEAVDVTRSFTAPAFSIAAALLGGGGGAAAGMAAGVADADADASLVDDAADADTPVTCCERWAEIILVFAWAKFGSTATADAYACAASEYSPLSSRSNPREY